MRQHSKMTDFNRHHSETARIADIHKLHVLEVSALLGCSQEEVRKRLERYGRSVTTEVKGKALWMRFLVINGVFSFWQEFKAEKAIEALRQLPPSHVRVLREGEVHRILVEELAPRDVILLEEGDRLSAEARLSAENELRVAPSTLSGESHLVRHRSYRATDPIF